jgi:hypothetical protein
MATRLNNKTNNIATQLFGYLKKWGGYVFIHARLDTKWTLVILNIR